MTRTPIYSAALSVVMLCTSAGWATAQATDPNADQAEGPETTVAILDTSVLFAIGAREAEQALRGSFGWPTFQEGFVEGVYFRFDPDGYARFSRSARLDEDVFEVVCEPATTQCTASKDTLVVGLNPSGQVQIQLAGITAVDTFFISDKKSELPLPPNILGPLDGRLEALLGTGGELLVKRELQTVQRLSLSGIAAVSTYLRWVAQGQSPRSLPRNWPIPAQIQQAQVSGMTQPVQWTANGATAVTQSGLPVATGTGVGLAASGQETELDRLRRTVLTLQSNLEQLSGQPIGMARPAAGTAAVGVVSNIELTSDPAAFAQQAQGRNLSVTAVNFGGDPGHSTVAAGTPATAAGPTESLLPVHQSDLLTQGSNAGGSGLMPASDMLHRIQSLERMMQEMRQEFSLQLRELRQVTQMGGAQMPTMAMTPQSGTVFARGLAPVDTVDQHSDLAEIERKLLARLMGETPPAATPQTSEASLDLDNARKPDQRQIIEDILEDLALPDAAEPADGAPSNDVEDTSSTADTSDGDFVTLADYLKHLMEQQDSK